MRFLRSGWYSWACLLTRTITPSKEQNASMPIVAMDLANRPSSLTNFWSKKSWRSVTQSQSDLRHGSHVPSCQSGYLRQLSRYSQRMLATQLLISELSRLNDHRLIDVGIEDRLDIPQFARRVAEDNV